MLQVKLHKGQLEVAKDEHRFRVICAGRRWGKSVLARLLILQWATEKVGTYWIVSPTYRQGKQNHWLELQKEIPRDWVAKKNEVELSITLRNGSEITLKGAENPDSLRGTKLRGLVVDEIASIRNWAWLWQEVLRPTLTDFEAPAIFISTPKGFNHFHQLYQQGQDNSGQSLYKSWRFTSYDNPYIPAGELDVAKKELAVDTFAQEYLADFRKFTGLVHKPWDRSIHLIEPFDIPGDWTYVRGFDFGSRDGTASVRVVVDDDWNFFVERCYLNNNRTIKEHADAIKSQDYQLGLDYGTHLQSFGDPSGGQWFSEFDALNIFIEKASKDIPDNTKYSEFCIEKLNEKLLPQIGRTIYLPDGRQIDDAPHLFVFDTPENAPFVKQIENQKWRENASGVILPVVDIQGDPTGYHYDLLSALKYLIVSYSPTTTDVQNDFSTWSIGASDQEMGISFDKDKWRVG